MLWYLTIQLHDKQVPTKIGEFESLEEAREKQTELLEHGYETEFIGEEADNYIYYPPHSIIKCQIRRN
jgi:hypothetical protein